MEHFGGEKLYKINFLPSQLSVGNISSFFIPSLDLRQTPELSSHSAC